MFVVMHEKPGCVSQFLGVFITRQQAEDEVRRTVQAFTKDGHHSNQTHFDIINAELNKNNIILG